MKKLVFALLVSSLILTLTPLLPEVKATESRVEINPSVASLQTSITINLRLEEPLDVSDTVLITFPPEMILPHEISDGLVTVDDVPSGEVTVDWENKTISLAIPAGTEINGSTVILIPLGCRIANPIAGGLYSLTVTVGETTQKLNFIVDSMLESAPAIFVSPDLVGKPISITIQLPRCDTLLIEEGDVIRVTFPVEFIMPEIPEIEHITVCGSPVPVVSLEEGIISLVAGTDVDADSPLIISIKSGFGIISPPWSDTFRLTVEVLGKLEETQTEVFQIRPLAPTVEISFTPHEPENGWFAEPPTVQLSSSVERVIYYSVSGSSTVEYEAPFVFEDEGVSVLGYVGKAVNGGWESVQKKTIQIDTQPPVLAELGDRAFTNQSEYTLEFSVEDSSPCSCEVVNRKASEADASVTPKVADPLGGNHFSADIQLSPGRNDFVFSVTDSCGRLIEQVRSITLDTTPPPLIIDTPVRGDVICGKMVRVEGKTEPDSTITVSGNVANVDENGQFVAVSSPSEEGPVSIEVIAKDQAGNTNTMIVPIIYISGTSIVMKVDSTKATFANSERELAVAPFKHFETTYVPLEQMAKALDYELLPDGDTEGKWLLNDLKENRKVFFSVGESKAYIHRGSTVYDIGLTNPPRTKEGYVCVPLEFVGKLLGLSPVEYADGRIIIRFCPR